MARPLPVRVDSTFPTDARGHQKFGRGLKAGPRGQELWPAIFEKAYAVSQRGYVHVNQGGDAGVALTALTGLPSRALTPVNQTRDWPSRPRGATRRSLLHGREGHGAAR